MRFSKARKASCLTSHTFTIVNGPDLDIRQLPPSELGDTHLLHKELKATVDTRGRF